MKKLFLSIILLTCTPLLFSNNENKIIPTLTTDQYIYLNAVYKEYKSNPSCVKSGNTETIAYVLSLLEKNIEICKDKLIPANTWKMRKQLIAIGSALLIAFTGLGIMAAYEIYKKHKEFISGKFNHIIIPSSLLKNLSSTQFTLAEKRYLKRFNVEKITINDNYGKYWYSKSPVPEYVTKHEHSTTNLSNRNKEKLTFTALNYAIKQDRSSIKSTLLELINPLSLVEIILICSAYPAFYTAFFYPQIMADQLKKDRELHNVLNKELESRFSFNGKSI